ncbi:hypothetical protein TraAM80_01317 [Trypanosoma rangeli]|uniref:Uncharacterized protein n=1 Tax=Trypanosoma rangeli TaxID=5698 RepID=A0A422NZ69_TRYRA|nr:uncharacterized protein TraAM80_01317 [Trypanosoma rangeli]RNF10756.1 hypothetical protein TraAM80_01317 [Trypanosoma rangeli]|eukprot:RNF10756.1 hypothetical protein TraAM80_01317 [Trypanosoma rangeli]
MQLRTRGSPRFWRYKTLGMYLGLLQGSRHRTPTSPVSTPARMHFRDTVTLACTDSACIGSNRGTHHAQIVMSGTGRTPCPYQVISMYGWSEILTAPKVGYFFRTFRGSVFAGTVSSPIDTTLWESVGRHAFIYGFLRDTPGAFHMLNATYYDKPRNCVVFHWKGPL